MAKRGSQQLQSGPQAILAQVWFTPFESAGCSLDVVVSEALDVLSGSILVNIVLLSYRKVDADRFGGPILAHQTFSESWR